MWTNVCIILNKSLSLLEIYIFDISCYFKFSFSFCCCRTGTSRCTLVTNLIAYFYYNKSYHWPCYVLNDVECAWNILILPTSTQFVRLCKEYTSIEGRWRYSSINERRSSEAFYFIDIWQWSRQTESSNNSAGVKGTVGTVNRFQNCSVLFARICSDRYWKHWWILGKVPITGKICQLKSA